jgi:competence protein ComEC
MLSHRETIRKMTLSNQEVNQMKTKKIRMILLVFCMLFIDCFNFIGHSAAVESQAGLTIHFIDVGQADSALVLCDQETMLIDGGNVADSDLIYTFLKKHDIKHLNYIVGTHAHEDHIGGLAGALNYATVDKAYCPVAEYDSKAFDNFVKYLARRNAVITIPAVGDTFTLGSATVRFLAPQKKYDKTNNTSIVLKITYGETSFLFTGDAERESEADILEAGYNLFSTVLKVGHHGSSTSTSYPFLREIMPRYAVISVGKGNSYGHPDENTLSRLRDADAIVYRTDIHGDISCNSDGSTVRFQTQKKVPPLFYDRIQPRAPDEVLEKPQQKHENPESVQPFVGAPEVETSYIGNRRSKIFHRAWCSAVARMNSGNRIPLEGREEAIDQDFIPCNICKP